MSPDNLSKVANMQTRPTDLSTLLEKNRQLENKVTNIELELVNSDEEHKIANQKSEEIVRNMHSKIEALQSSLEKSEVQRLALDKDNKSKDEIIQNLNTCFNQKVAGLKSKVDELEGLNKEATKKEKKAMKKMRQKAARDSTFSEHNNLHGIKVIASETVIKDENNNLLEVPEVTDYATTHPTLCQPALERMSPFSTAIQSGTPPNRPPSTPLSPHTPPGTPPDLKRDSEPQSEPEEDPGALLGYFVVTRPNSLSSKVTPAQQESVRNTNISALLTADYIKDINKIDLGPRMNDLSKM